ncbi:MAG: DUF2634 domain-containing protein [Oscillospiraceae bacterium]
MIPKSALTDETQLEPVTSPTHTYHLDLQSKRILGMVDGLDAITQMVYKTLYTERYAYLIYNWDYGVGLEEYLGEDINFVMADITGAITEALMVDDRVLSVDDFQMEKTKIDALTVQFTVITTEGNQTISKEVPV